MILSRQPPIKDSHSRACVDHLMQFMENIDWKIREKPYDLRERLFLFGCLIVRVAQFLHTRGPIAVALS